MSVGSLSHPIAGTFNFLVMTTPTGWPIDQFAVDEETLTSPGVDGIRWRTTSVQHVPISMTTLADDTTYALCITAARNYRKCKTGDPVILYVTISGKAYTFRNVHVLEVAPVVLPGGAFGSGATSSSAAHVRCQWQLILMDTASTGT